MTKYVGLIGYPLKHSISPDFQQAAFDYYELDIHYEAWEVEPGRLRSVVEGIRQPRNLGANVTVPHKEGVASLMDELEEPAHEIGAVNVIVKRGDKLIGYNTDADAFLRALRQEAGFEPQDKRVILLGAGGVARAASFALVRAKVGALTIVNRTFERAEALAFDLRGSLSQRQRLSLARWGDTELAEALAGCDLMVNCTSIGMKHSPEEGRSPVAAEQIAGGVLVYDLVYNPMETPLLASARKAGATVLGGLSMLVYQGAAAFELWTDRAAPLDIMFEAARGALER